MAKKQHCSQNNEQAQLLLKMRETLSELRRAYAAFNNATESDLIEACIFEINSLQSKYSYLLRRAKALSAAHSVMLELDSDKEHI